MKFFYVTMIRGRRVAYLAGPFLSHQAALDRVDESKRLAIEKDAYHHFDTFGTASRADIIKTWLGCE